MAFQSSGAQQQQQQQGGMAWGQPSPAVGLAGGGDVDFGIFGNTPAASSNIPMVAALPASIPASAHMAAGMPEGVLKACLLLDARELPLP
jgi:hypothetical protein